LTRLQEPFRPDLYTMRDPVPQIIPSKEIEAYSVFFVNEIIKKLEKNGNPEIDLSFYADRAAYEAETARAFVRPVYSEKREDRFTIHVCEKELKDIPFQALQGWMEHETMRCIQTSLPEYALFNFRNHIFPLMPVTGLAENHLRELIQSIQAGLKKYNATKALTHMGNGVQQAHFHFFKIGLNEEDNRLYEKALPHAWTKALFLCRKFRELMPISWLADERVEFSQDLASFWWKGHDYLIPEDRTFLEEISSIPQGFVDALYSDMVVELFKRVKSQYLLSLKDTPTLPSPTPTLH
jgi:hypothetical protein